MVRTVGEQVHCPSQNPRGSVLRIVKGFAGIVSDAGSDIFTASPTRRRRRRQNIADPFYSPLGRLIAQHDKHRVTDCSSKDSRMRDILATSVSFGAIRSSSLAIVVVLCSFMPTGASAEEAVRIESAYSFPDTLAHLRSTLESKSFRIFATIDHRAAAQSAGLDMPPTTVLVYGSPQGGTPLMLSAPDFALELPLRVLVREDRQGKVYVTYNPSTTLEERHGLPPGMAEKLAPAEKLIAAAVTASSGER